MAKYVGYKRPKDTKKTIRHLLVYLGMHKWSFLLVALLVLISAGANIIRFVPPLIIEKSDVDEMVKRLEAVIKEM